MNTAKAILIISFIFHFTTCSEKQEPISENDRKNINSLIEENDKVHQFLIKTEDGLPSLEGIQTQISALEKSSNSELANLAKSMRVNLSKVAGKDQENDFEAYSLFSENLAELLKKFPSDNSVNRFYCPMVKKTWVAKGRSVQNPYAPEMRDCGELILN
ncbi:LIC13259/LIC11441 family protein [Leptospira sp. GIMC2001]|uniref:LIC13259/LIC11441 family protein n=1 Tax=Leptospira sp. GIMC2001 TaxID=1513297 RepID=UPI002349F92A|nr:hypothetical protein [Leptospira sp. GIMC2001]WCL50112.1 hypothetical protein O4O04_04645 [Leptospira sp. GIMC2001]